MNPDVKDEIKGMSGIQNRILTIRGVRVILDSDLAELYGIPTFIFNQSIKRNVDRFPEKFRFQLNSDEFTNLKSQIVISSLAHGGRRKRPWVFTEHGALMASTVLKSAGAVRMSVEIIEAFVRLREMAAANEGLAVKLAEIDGRLGEHDEAISEIVKAINEPAPAPALGSGI